MTRHFPDVEEVLLDFLEGSFPELAPGPVRHCDTETPADLRAALPFVRVSLVTGRDNGVTDFSVVDIDVFADSRTAAYALARDIRSRLTGGPHRVGEAVIDRALTEEKPRTLPWADETVRRLGATYRISARR